MKIIFTRQAINDLQRLRQFIEIHNKKAAAKIAQRLRDAIKRLQDFPLLGIAIKNELGLHLRELVVDKYLVSYLVSDDKIYILQIWHGKEHLD
ncbi:MAG: type II toxin-antitoxin system RelE/ParE family toxin [Gammaproteobacteria bacterium]